MKYTTTTDSLKKGIYCILNTLTNKRYIGSTSNSFRKRRYRHLERLRANKHHSKHLQSSWNKYGESVFEFIILETIKDELIAEWLLKREQWWIDLYGAADREFGYNCCPNASSWLGYKHSEETKLKISQNKKGFKYSKELALKKEDIHCKIMYTFLNPSGKSETFKNMRKFCRENNLNRGRMKKLILGDIKEHRGWTFVKKEAIENTGFGYSK